MKYNEELNLSLVDFGDMEPKPFILGLLSAFDNRFQACADSFFKEITWKQFFAIICVNLCTENPTINELSEIMGSSHQNVKQILIKLEKKEFIKMIPDKSDKRKQRITLTEKCMEFMQKNKAQSDETICRIFDGIDEDSLLTTIRTLLSMEKNISEIGSKAE